MAYERNVEGRERLYPTARLQVVRELFIGEWQARTAAFGEQLMPVYFPTGGGGGGAAGGGGGGSSADEGLSAYERQRLEQIAANRAKARAASHRDPHARAVSPPTAAAIDAAALSRATRAQLTELGILDDVAAMRKGKAKKKPAAQAPKKAAAAASAAPARASGRLASQPRVSYKAEKVQLASDDEGDGSGSDDDDGSDAELDDDDDDDDGDDGESGDEGGECVRCGARARAAWARRGAPLLRRARARACERACCACVRSAAATTARRRAPRARRRPRAPRPRRRPRARPRRRRPRASAESRAAPSRACSRPGT